MDRIWEKNALNLPNLLTVLRIALLPMMVLRFRSGDSLGAAGIYLLAMLTDAADGVIARRTGQITAMGKLLDPIADKLSLLTVLALFAADGQIPKWFLDVVFAKEALLILGSAAALRYGIVVSALPVGKITTLSFVLSALARFVGWRMFADCLLWLSLGLSVLALIWYAAAFCRRLCLQKVIV